jgi:hypothetical protein
VDNFEKWRRSPDTFNPFTVIGYYDETGERYNGHHVGSTWADAVDAAIAEAGLDLVIVDVLAGHHFTLTLAHTVEHACDWPSGDTHGES